MSRKRLLWRLYPSYLIIIAFSLVAISIYASRSIRSIDLILVGCALAAAAAVLSLFLAAAISRPLRQVTNGARHFANGELDFRMPVPDSQEFAPLADNLNKMAASLNERIHIISAQRNELEAVLSGMAEGVLVVDGDHRIITMNKAAAMLLNVDANVSVGHRIQEVVYNPELHQLVADVLKEAAPIEKDIAVHKDKKRYLQVHAAPLDKAEGKGAVIVLNDVTRVRQLENIRREFVSNVSHELKTPITSIKGFVETLLDGALENPAECRQFLEIIARHTSRLNAIIEDILSLSRIEQEIDNRNIVREVGSIKDVLAAAAAACRPKGAEKQIEIVIDCDQTLTALINAPLLEQAIINLIDNAIKYSDPEKHISIQARRENGEVIISVADEGYGIAAEHLPRIFERFYVADKARSRKLGGTGLGLSIVKHIISVHSGKVSVESEPDKGSTFTISLPAK